MSDTSKIVWSVLGGMVLGAMGAAAIKRGSLRPQTARILSYGYNLKDKLVEQAEVFKENCEDLAAEAKEQYEDRKENTEQAQEPVAKTVRKPLAKKEE